MRNHILNLVLFALVITIIGCGSGGSGGGEKRTILAQSPLPFMTSSLNGPAVFHATGLHASMGSNTIMIGQWVANPNSATLTAEYAGNDSGNSIPLGNFTATYSIAVNGRANLIPSSGGVPAFY